VWFLLAAHPELLTKIKVVARVLGSSQNTCLLYLLLGNHAIHQNKKLQKENQKQK